MTPQEIFDKVATHLLSQNVKSQDAMRCVYRGPFGRKCAVGVLIPDELYQPIMEGRQVQDFSDAFGACGTKALRAALDVVGILPTEMQLLQALQNTHDGYDPREWMVQLGALAMQFGLSDAILK